MDSYRWISKNARRLWNFGFVYYTNKIAKISEKWYRLNPVTVPYEGLDVHHNFDNSTEGIKLKRSHDEYELMVTLIDSNEGPGKSSLHRLYSFLLGIYTFCFCFRYFLSSETRKHGRGTRGAAPASDAAARASDRVCIFFSWIRADSARFAPTRLDLRRCGSIRAESASIRTESGWFGQNRAVSAVSAAGRYGRNRPKQAGNGRNRPKYGCQSRKLHSSFFFCESRHSMCFLKIF